MHVPPATAWQLPSVLVLAAVGTGLALTAASGWVLGSRVVGLALLLGACLRATLTTSSAGWLAVRTRALDVAVLACLGAAVLVLTQTIPRV